MQCCHLIKLCCLLVSMKCVERLLTLSNVGANEVWGKVERSSPSLRSKCDLAKKNYITCAKPPSSPFSPPINLHDVTIRVYGRYHRYPSSRRRTLRSTTNTHFAKSPTQCRHCPPHPINNRDPRAVSLILLYKCRVHCCR